jgi:Mg2+ and Co2+ transporter CorA
MLKDLRQRMTTSHEKVSSTRVSIISAVSQLVRELASRQAKGEEGAETETLWNKHSDAVYTVELRSADDNKLQTTLEELDDRLRDIIAAMNDEIQIVIGSVQLEDSKAMRKQADLTMRLTESTMQQTKTAMRQTKWTIALALLAALYLPMTLVTGIYGMDIKEISEDKGRPWWWVVVTWVLTMVITVGIFGQYAFVEWRWYQEEASKNEIASKQDSAEELIRGEKHGPVAVTDEATGTGCLLVLRVKLRWRRRPKTSQSQAEETTV